jgi:hypothetical protein
METNHDNKPLAKVAYAITERSGRSYWNRIGRAFTNKDGSITVRLDAVPVSGTLQIRDWEPREESASSGGFANAAPKIRDDIPTELPF